MFRATATAMVLGLDGQGVRQRPMVLPPPLHPGFLPFSAASALGSHPGLWKDVTACQTEQPHRVVNVQCRLCVMMTFILFCLKRIPWFLRACESHTWYKNDVLGSGEQLETQGEGAKGRLEGGRAGVFLRYLHIQSIFLFKFCAKIHHSVVLGAGSYRNGIVMEC